MGVALAQTQSRIYDESFDLSEIGRSDACLSIKASAAFSSFSPAWLAWDRRGCSSSSWCLASGRIGSHANVLWASSDRNAPSRCMCPLLGSPLFLFLSLYWNVVQGAQNGRMRGKRGRWDRVPAGLAGMQSSRMNSPMDSATRTMILLRNRDVTGLVSRCEEA